MATSATVLCGGSPSEQHTGTWTTDTVLLDADGATLSWIGQLATLDDGHVMLDEVDAPDVLLRYYFGRGGRLTMLSSVRRTVEGRLETCWTGDGRRWWLELNEVQRPV